LNLQHLRPCITGVKTWGLNTTPRSQNINASGKPFNIQEKGVAMLDSQAIISMSMRLPTGDWVSASVYKDEKHTDKNPIFNIIGTDVNGHGFNWQINLNDVKPNSMHFIEMLAVDAQAQLDGKPIGAARSVIGAIGAGFGEYNIFTKVDGIKILEETMVVMRENRDLKGYFHYKSVVDSLTNFMGQRLRIQNDLAELQVRSKF